jgi:DNA-binding NarL/FixJ family response regulator
MKKMIQVLLVDDHNLVRNGFRAILSNEPNIQVVGEAKDGREAVQLTEKLEPDIVLMDLAMPEMNGTEATRQILSAKPKVKVLALSAYHDHHLVAQMLRAGASGFLTKVCLPEELIRAIQTVASGQTYLSPQVTTEIIEEYLMCASDEASAVSLLTQREREVLQLVAEGRTAKEIAKTLHISVRTVENHRAEISKKLGVESLAELIKIAIKEGITPL